ncbi:hypothetical protein [Mucilaginibacter sp. 10I4]|uniref:hypothetical protein n=1 Tax=Mucilaginibacter sp. 10I4 TaxID=3048580 RepID=UPI002B2257C1|nr:hypothetical protein [Mucilaginibacter sp. 10I4]MEB0264078.1 hypothetical protein [Mucilaginibacter sp. 10I4]
MAKSISHDRKITIYPSNGLKDMVVAECALNNLSYSDVVSKAISDHYGSMDNDRLTLIKDKVQKMAMYPKKQA